MATAPFVIERKVHYHGIWSTGLQVTDQFLKNIAEQFDTKPPCPTFLTLNINAISLVVLTRSGDKELHRDQIAFDVLREIAVNSYNSKCLMILYPNNKNRYSIIVCSCRDEKEALNISLAYKQLKNYRLVNPNLNNHIKQNWTLKKSTRDMFVNSDKANGNGPRDDAISTRSRTESGVMNETFAFLNSEDVSVNGDDDGDEDVFGGLEAVERVPAGGEESRTEAFHAGLQVNLDKSENRGSVSSRSSFISFQSMTEEVKVIENGGSDPNSPGIGQSEFFRKESAEEQEDLAERLPDGDEETGENNSNSQTKTLLKMVKTDDNEQADYRSIATQTIGGGIARRYKKRVGSSQKPNAYREMAAHRKSGQLNGSTNTISTNNSSFTSNSSTNGFNGSTNLPTATTEYANFTSMANGNFLRARSSSFNSDIRHKSLFIPRQIQTSRSSVSRPIEDVYKSWSRSKRSDVPSRSKRVIVYTQQRK